MSLQRYWTAGPNGDVSYTTKALSIDDAAVTLMRRIYGQSKRLRLERSSAAGRAVCYDVWLDDRRIDTFAVSPFGLDEKGGSLPDDKDAGPNA